MDLMNPETISPPQPVPASTVGTALGEARTSPLSRILLAIAVLFVVVRALPILTFPMGNDQGTYLTIGQGLLERKQPYRDLWDNKPPGIFIVYAGIAKLFGRALWSVPVVDILLLLLISYLLLRFTEPYLGRVGAALAVMVHAFMYGRLRHFSVAQAETPQLVCGGSKK
jgi:4-amino-4-deoxy-L-arabinose transferase-like glycosyltransferase